MNIKIKELGIMEIFYKKESLGNNKDEYTGMYKIFMKDVIGELIGELVWFFMMIMNWELKWNFIKEMIWRFNKKVNVDISMNSILNL